MFKNLYSYLISLLLCLVVFSGIANAGALKKITGVSAAYLIKYETKKVIRKEAKHATGNLVKNELKTGTFKRLRQINKLNKKNTYSKYTENDAHHIPSAEFMKKYGVNRNDAVAINVEKIRHGLTRTYKSRNKTLLNNNEKPREALARDIKNMREIYRYEKENLVKRKRGESALNYSNRKKTYDKDLRTAFKEVIKENKKKFPDIFKKEVIKK